MTTPSVPGPARLANAVYGDSSNVPAKEEPWNGPSRLVTPRVQNRRAGLLIVANVPRYHGQPVMQRRRGDDEIGL